jgi:hypothetical protein
MLTAERMSAWGRRYRIAADGRPVAVWDPSWWRSGGDFEVDGRRFEVRASTWGTRYRMVDESGGEVAVAERAGRRRWTVRAGGRTYDFRRASFWGTRQELLVDDVRAGSLRRTSAWSGSVEADLPGMPLPIQIFVVGVQIAIWRARQSAAASG